MTYVIVEACVGTKDNSCVEACPVHACVADYDVPADQQHMIERNAGFFGG